MIEDAVTLKVRRKVIDQFTGKPVTILVSQTVDRVPQGELSISEAYRRQRNEDRSNNELDRRPQYRYCVVCAEWKSVSAFDDYEPGLHLDRCRACALMSGQGRPIKDGHKQCASCFEIKPFKLFGLDKHMRSGRQSSCYTCESHRKAEAQRLEREREREALIEAGLYRPPGRPRAA